MTKDNSKCFKLICHWLKLLAEAESAQKAQMHLLVLKLWIYSTFLTSSLTQNQKTNHKSQSLLISNLSMTTNQFWHSYFNFKEYSLKIRYLNKVKKEQKASPSNLYPITKNTEKQHPKPRDSKPKYLYMCHQQNQLYLTWSPGTEHKYPCQKQVSIITTIHNIIHKYNTKRHGGKLKTKPSRHDCQAVQT